MKALALASARWYTARMQRLTLTTLVLALSLLALPAQAAEGLWPYNMAPKAELKEAHGVELTDAWLERARLASVRFNNGGSGSFVSAKGLVMTNHHVGSDCIQKLSQGKTDYMAEGFVAASGAEELRCPDLELNQLRAIEDVTKKVEAAMAAAKTDEAKNKARKGEMSKLEKACADEAKGSASRAGGLVRCDVVTLYAGGAYHLYKYRKYQDIRLAFAPEFQIGFFGGDQDNFGYPRMCLDAAFFRVYEADKPIESKAFLPLSQVGAKDAQLVFVSGHPGRTGRLEPPSQVGLRRDVTYPFLLRHLKALRAVLKAYMDRGPAQFKTARDSFFGVENGIKAITGFYQGLKDPALSKAIEARHTDAKARLEKMGRKDLLQAWGELKKAYEAERALYRPRSVTEGRSGPSGKLWTIAKTLLRMGDELPKPNAERLREYRDSGLQSLELRLFSKAPLDPALECERIRFGLEEMKRVLGDGHPAVKAALQGKTPQQRAKEVIEGTKLVDVEVRKALRKGGKAAVDAAKDPLIELVRSIDGTARELRAEYEKKVESVERLWGGKLAQGWATAFGTSVYPDATFTLRLNYGDVKGYKEPDGTPVAWATTFADLYKKYDEAKGAMPYALPKRWLEARDKVDLKVPFNFVSTNDIHGGNSGSPVFDKDLKTVGLIFDGNIHSLPNRFLYRAERERAVSVHTHGILHALDVVYGAKALRAELDGAK